MKTYEQSIKGERSDLGAGFAEAQMKVGKVEFDAAAAEEEARNLEVELMKAEAASERKERAEQQGKESKERINEAIG